MQCNNRCNSFCLIWQHGDRRYSWMPDIDGTKLFHSLYKYEQVIGDRGWQFDRDYNRGDCNCILIILIKGATILNTVLL